MAENAAGGAGMRINGKEERLMPDITMYAGWINFPTWMVYTAITDDEYLRKAVYDLAEVCDSVYHLGDAIKQEIDDSRQDPISDFYPTFLWDLMQYALNQVSWYDIAGHIWQEVHDEE